MLINNVEIGNEIDIFLTTITPKIYLEMPPKKLPIPTAIIYSTVSIILGGLAIYIGIKLNQIYSN